MKSLILTILLISTNAMATNGIDCNSVDGTLELYTTEASAPGDNVITLGMNAPWIQDEEIKFEKVNGELSMTREEGTVYMASNSKGQSVTLVKDSHVRAGLTVSTAYIRSSQGVEVETLYCEPQ